MNKNFLSPLDEDLEAIENEYDELTQSVYLDLPPEMFEFNTPLNFPLELDFFSTGVLQNNPLMGITEDCLPSPSCSESSLSRKSASPIDLENSERPDYSSNSSPITEDEDLGFHPFLLSSNDMGSNLSPTITWDQVQNTTAFSTNPRKTELAKLLQSNLHNKSSRSLTSVKNGTKKSLQKTHHLSSTATHRERPDAYHNYSIDRQASVTKHRYHPLSLTKKLKLPPANKSSVLFNLLIFGEDPRYGYSCPPIKINKTSSRSPTMVSFTKKTQVKQTIIKQERDNYS